MKKILITLTSALFAVALASPSFAGDKEDKAAGSGGKVTTVTDDTLTVKSKKFGEQTFKIGSETKVTKADGTGGATSDIKVGTMVWIKPGASPDQAARVKLIGPKKQADAPKTDAPAAE